MFSFIQCHCVYFYLNNSYCFQGVRCNIFHFQMLFLRFCPTLFLESVNTDFENLFLSKLHFRLFTTFSQTSTSNKPNSIFSFLHVSFFTMLFFVVNGYVSIFFWPNTFCSSYVDRLFLSLHHHQFFYFSVFLSL